MPYAALSYFRNFLEEFKCTQISFSSISSHPQVVGFNCEYSELIEELLKFLKLPVKVHKVNNHYVLFTSMGHLVDLMNSHFKIILSEWQKSHAQLDGKLEKDSSRFMFNSEESYFKINNDNILSASLEKLGLKCEAQHRREEIYHPYTYYSSSYPLQLLPTEMLHYVPGEPSGMWEIHGSRVSYQDIYEKFLFIENMADFFQAYGKNIITQILARTQALLSLATTESLSSGRKISTFEPQIVPLIMSYVNYTELQSPKIPEMKQASSTIPCIELALTRLKKENDNDPSTKKIRKINFLEFILAIKKANPFLEDVVCVEIAIKQNPYLYRQAIAGYFSRRTYYLIEGIRHPETNIPAVLSPSHKTSLAECKSTLPPHYFGDWRKPAVGAFFGASSAGVGIAIVLGALAAGILSVGLSLAITGVLVFLACMVKAIQPYYVKKSYFANQGFYRSTSLFDPRTTEENKNIPQCGNLLS